MARKSKGFSELLHQQQDDEQTTVQSFKRLQKKVQKTTGKDLIQDIATSPKGVAKMSDVLEEFIDPYKETTSSFEDVESLLSIAVLAWNIALLPDEDRQEAIEIILSEAASGMNQKSRAELQTLIHQMIERKDCYFSSFQRYIANFDLQPQGDSYFLSVASSLKE